MTEPAPPTPPGSDPGATLGFLLLRLWLALRAIVTGIEKFAGTTAGEAPVTIDGTVNAYGLTEATRGKVYGLEHYHGVPASLYDSLEAEPLIPSLTLTAFDVTLGPLLILLGIALLLGIATRTTLFLMGLVYTGLTLGLILLQQDAGIAWLGIHILLVSMALVLARHNRFQLFPRF